MHEEFINLALGLQGPSPPSKFLSNKFCEEDLPSGKRGNLSSEMQSTGGGIERTLVLTLDRPHSQFRSLLQKSSSCHFLKFLLSQSIVPDRGCGDEWPGCLAG